MKGIVRKLSVVQLVLLTALALLPLAKAEAPAPKTNQAKYEVRFLTGMIDHHAMAVMTGMMCEERAVHEELRDLCHEIVTAQIAEIELMQGWLQDWYGITHEPQMKPGDEKRMSKLAGMSGAEFEIEFMTMMIRHHEMAIREGMHCLDRAYHSELVELCENIIATQAEEIVLMEQWLCEWYQVCQ
jgi:uncharacterized protein (DUF305 family)